MLDCLATTAQQVQHAEPISAHPDKLKEQISENMVSYSQKLCSLLLFCSYLGLIFQYPNKYVITQGAAKNNNNKKQRIFQHFIG